MAEHRCEPWNKLGINCPSGLLELVGVFEVGVEDEFEFGERDHPVIAFPGHRKAKAPPPAQAQVAEMMMLMQMWRGMVVRGVGELTPQPARIPVEMVREAYNAGARGRELGLWVAASAASLAIGLRFGPSALQQVPKVLLEGLRGRPGQRTGGAPRGGGMAYNFDARRRLLALLQGGSLRKLSGSLVSGLVGNIGGSGFGPD